MFATAKALFDYHVKNEDAIVGTIAFAWYVEQPTVEIAEKYEEIEVLGTAGNVPVLRLKKVSATVVEGEGTQFPSAVKVKVFSRHAKPPEVAARYKDVLLDRFIEYLGSRGGNIGWSFQDTHLDITIRPEEVVPAHYHAEINVVTGAKAFPRDRLYAFPSPSLVQGVYGTLLGSADKRTRWGFASFLDDVGRPWNMNAETAIPACVAALLEKECGGRPKVRRPIVARALNAHVLSPLGLTELPESSWSSDQTVWRDAEKVLTRLERVGSHLQRAGVRDSSDT